MSIGDDVVVVKFKQIDRDTKRLLSKVWRAMNDRCYNVKCQGYPYYGGRGVAVCEEWRRTNNRRDNARKRFVVRGALSGYGPNLTLDRINNDGNYEPDNCRWATRYEQQVNKRNWSSKGGRFFGIFKTGTKWKAKISHLGKRISLGTFDTDELAAAAYDKEAIRLRGSNTRLNFPVSTESPSA